MVTSSIGNDKVLRLWNWPLGLIVKTYSGDNGRVRRVDIRYHDKIYRRATNRLILLYDE